MDHAAAVAHLRKEVANTARAETGRLVTTGEPAFFGAVRAVMSDLDYVAALYYGWNGARRDQLATKKKTVRFIREVVNDAAAGQGYDRWASHLYELYRTGVVHLRAPKILSNADNDPPKLGWLLMQQRAEPLPAGLGPGQAQHLRPAHRKGHDTLLLPLAIDALFEDYLAAVDLFANGLQDEAAADETPMLDRWRQTADALCDPDPSQLQW
ncbi:hypothetical protein GKE82_05630 [Conexibacter sp. W3-3-2]|uniref:hypothetical protein n=1 Tax=Conexibacter sp. W3-3-2 TaxID=2675227 RepID=UPI0012B931CF|nr:hypothetical protein [Conexibacter sp. W3-3-2]MTD43800.1 hypothetical protein [Conexibacter sp. W3-3-2]